MINLKELNKTAAKTIKLIDVYGDYLIKERIPLDFELFETREHFTSCPEKQFKKINVGEEWGGDFIYGWFKGKITVPESMKNEDVFLEKRSGGVEALVFANNKPIGLFDDVENGKDSVFRTHKYINLKDFTTDGNVSVAVEDYCGHTFYGTMPHEKKQTFGINGYREKCVYKGFFLVSIRKSVDEFTDNLKLLRSLFKCFDESSFANAELLNEFEKIYAAVGLIPEDGFDENRITAVNKLINSYIKKQKLTSLLNIAEIGLIGHSHLDTAWLWTEDETKRKAAETASNAVTLLDKYPDYKFVMSSALYLQWFKEYYPDIYNNIVRLNKSGRFEFTGGTYVECDCNLIGSEALCRQFLRGQRIFKENLGHYSDCFWLPDTFGYAASLPQICLKSGIKYFVTTKLSWNDTNVFPYDTFIWKGIDGSFLTAHFTSIQDNPDPECIVNRSKNLKNKHLNNKALISYGYGDGGGGPQEKMVKTAITSCKLFKNVRHTTVSEFMESLKNENLPVYAGELYLELHRGTYTSNSELKYLNRQLENKLNVLELLECVTGRRELKKVSDKYYDTLLINQFHDILPGTCIKEVNEKAIKDNFEALSGVNAAISEIAGKGGYYFNPLSFDYKSYFSVKGADYISISGDKRKDVYAEIPSYSSSAAARIKYKPVKYSNGNISNDFYKVKLNGNGEFISLFNKADGVEFVQKGKTFNLIEVYEDEPALWDNWNIDADYKLKLFSVGKIISRELISNSGEFLRIREVYKLTELSKLTRDLVFCAENGIITIENKIDWNDKHKLVKVRFDTNLVTDFYRSEIQFGNVTRSVHRNTSVEQAQFETCNHKYLCLSEAGRSFTLLNDCKYGSSVEEGSVSMTLLKSGTHPDGTADIGTHYFTYRIKASEKAFSFENVVKEGYFLNYVPVSCGVKLNAPVTVKGGSVIAECVKFAEDDNSIILRLYESEGTRCNCLISSEGKDIYETDLLEENEEFMGSNSAELLFTPYEIRTVRLK